MRARLGLRVAVHREPALNVVVEAQVAAHADLLGAHAAFEVIDELRIG